DDLARLLRRRLRVLRERRRDHREEPGRAEPALQAVTVSERLLHWRQRAVRLGQALNGRDVRPVSGDREQQAGPDSYAVHQDRAGTAYAVLATHVRARQAQVVPQAIRQQPARGHLDVVADAIDVQADLENFVASHRPALARA